MLNITHHQGNTNQNHNETPPHLSEWLILTTQATTAVGEDAEKEDLFCTASGNANQRSHSENSMEVPQKIKNRTTIWPSNCTTRYLSKGYRCAVSKGHMHPNVYSSAMDNSHMERAQMSIDWWMHKEDVVYIHNGILLDDPKEWNLAICNYMDGTRGYYAKWNETEKDTLSDDFPHVWNLR